MEGVDACLADSVVETAINGDWGRRLPVDNGDRRRGGTVNIGDGLECLMGEGQVASGPCVVEGDGGLALVGGGTTREATRGRWGRSRAAGDGVGSRP